MTLSKVYTNIAKIIYPTLTAVNIMTQYKKKEKEEYMSVWNYDYHSFRN